MGFKIPLLSSFLFALPGLCLTAVSTSSKFTSVLSQAKLQYPDSSLVATSSELLAGYVQDYFQLVDDDIMQFAVSGDSARSELREMESDTELTAWYVEDGETHTTSATVIVPTQEDGIEEVTVMQLHGTVDPAVRISWVSSVTIDGVTSTDVMISTIRTSIGDETRVKTVLSTSPTSSNTYEIEAVGSTVSISVGGTTITSEDISTFSGYACYFKAGAYNNNPTSDSATAVAEFDTLDW